jgi:hypothetical protein
MATKEYNGWTNYETWLVKLWLDSSESDASRWQDETRQVWHCAFADKPFTKSEKAKLILADLLKEHHDNACLDVLEAGTKSTATFYHDLMNAALSEVNWHEIADWLLSGHCEDYGKELVALEGGAA